MAQDLQLLALTRNKGQVANLTLPTTAATPTIRDPGALLSIQLCTQWDDVLAFRDAWNDLLDHIPTASIFMTPEWLGSWWRAFGKNKKLRALVFFDDRNQVVGLALFFLEDKSVLNFGTKTLRMVGAGSTDSDALDFVVLPGAEGNVAMAFLEWLARERMCDVCSLETLPASSALGRHIAHFVKKRGWRAFTERCPNFFINLPPTWEEYVQGLKPQFRPLLTRYPKRLATRYRVRTVRCERSQDLEPSLRMLFDLHQKRWNAQGEAGAFSVPERQQFYFGMAEEFLRRGWLEFWLLSLNNEITAAQLCFRYRDTVSLLQEGFDPRYSADKVGYALRAAVLKEMIHSGAKRYDFLGGADPYKLNFGAREGGYLDLHFSVSSWAGKLELAQRQTGKQLRRWVRDSLPEPLLKLLRQKGRSVVGRRPMDQPE